MSFPTFQVIRTALAAGTLAAAGIGYAQDYPQAAPPPPTANQQYGAPGYGQGQNPGYNQNGPQPGYGGPQSQYPNGGPNQPPPAYSAPAPSHLTIRPGTYITIRTNQFLSSDRNQAGDVFSGSLVRPIVVDGVVVAEPGQQIEGRVAEAKKAGRVSGTSSLGLQVTDLTLVDGTQTPIQSSIVGRSGPTSVGRDAAAIGGTTALGAAIGAAAGWGTGAAIGAGAGALAGTLGVLLTRGEPTVVNPEAVLTFRVDSPVNISTDRAPQAFRYVEPGDYERTSAGSGPGPGPQSMAYGPPPAYAAPAYPAPAYAAPYPYYGYGYYPYWGPSFGFYFGPRAYYRGGYYWHGGGYGHGGYHR